jgi:hypothetical protein
MSAIARSLKLLTVDGLDSDTRCAEAEAKADADALADLIRVQRRLQSLTIARSKGNMEGIVESLHAVNHTLRHLHFSSCNFDEHRPLDAIAECTVLDTLRINHCGTISADAMCPLRTARFSRLATLDFTYTFAPTEIFIDMLQNANESLRELWLAGDVEHASNVVEAVARHCPNVVVFEVTVARDATAYLPLLFGGCARLEVLKFYGDHATWSGFADASKDIATVGRIAPTMLRELVIVTNWSITADALDQFLSECNAFLMCLALHCQYNLPDYTPYCETVYRYASRMGMNLEDVGYRIVDRLLQVSDVIVFQRMPGFELMETLLPVFLSSLRTAAPRTFFVYKFVNRSMIFFSQ